MSRGRSGQGPQAANRRHGGRRSLPAEIGRTPHRDRSSSASRSVALRREIGPLPARDRSHSAARSVHFRIEIGRVPHRNRSHSTPSSGRSEKATRSAASRSESTKGAQHHHTSTVRSALVPIFPRTGIRRREHESQREPFLRPAAVNVRSASRSPFGSVDRLRRLRRGCTREEDPLKKRQPFFA